MKHKKTSFAQKRKITWEFYDLVYELIENQKNDKKTQDSKDIELESSHLVEIAKKVIENKDYKEYYLKEFPHLKAENTNGVYEIHSIFTYLISIITERTRDTIYKQLKSKKYKNYLYEAIAKLLNIESEVFNPDYKYWVIEDANFCHNNPQDFNIEKIEMYHKYRKRRIYECKSKLNKLTKDKQFFLFTNFDTLFYPFEFYNKITNKFLLLNNDGQNIFNNFLNFCFPYCSNDFYKSEGKIKKLSLVHTQYNDYFLIRRLIKQATNNHDIDEYELIIYKKEFEKLLIYLGANQNLVSIENDFNKFTNYLNYKLDDFINLFNSIIENVELCFDENKDDINIVLLFALINNDEKTMITTFIENLCSNPQYTN